MSDRGRLKPYFQAGSAFVFDVELQRFFALLCDLVVKKSVIFPIFLFKTICGISHSIF
jgi:hypothetical protein